MFIGALLISSLAAHDGGDIRMTCVDGAEIYSTYKASFQELQTWTNRLKDLAILAANGTLSVTDRNFIQDECAVILDDMSRIISQTNYIDTFGDQYYPIENGLSFLLSYRSNVTDRYLVSKFKFPKISTELLGRMAKQEFSIADPRSDESQIVGSLKLNGKEIRLPDSYDDTVSSDQGWRSSVAWKRAINGASSSTNVKAEVLDSVVQLEVNPQFFEVNVFGLTLNGVNFSGIVDSTRSFVDLINDYWGSTGIKARYIAQSTNTLELYSEDGRNIEIRLGGNARLESLLAASVPKAGLVKTGRLFLTSAKVIEVEDKAGILGSQRRFKIPVDAAGLTGLDVSSSEHASDSLSTIEAALAQLLKPHKELDRLGSACSRSE